MNYFNEMEYLSQEMKMQKNIMMQSDKNLLEEKQIWEKERAMLLKKLRNQSKKTKNMKSNQIGPKLFFGKKGTTF